MPIVIGAKPESHFQDPLGLLTDCHRRVEGFLSVLSKVANQAGGGALTQEQRAALETALRYFKEAAPKHTADEEQSLFPRLRAIDRPDLHEIIERVAALEKDHTEAEADHAEVDRLGREWLSADRLAENDALRLVQLLAKLSGHYQSHIAIEEREVFPAAAAALSKSQREAVGAEMAARRGLPPAP